MPDQTAIVTVMPSLPSTLETKIPNITIFTEIEKLINKDVAKCTDDDIEIAKGYRKDCKDRIFFVMEDEKGPQYSKHTKAAYALHKSLVASAKLFTDPAEKTINRIDTFIGRFDQEKRRLKDLADQQAREEQEKERQKIMNAAQAKIDRAMKSTGKIETQIEEMQKIADDLLTTDEARTLAARQLEILRLQLENKQDQAAAIQKTAEQAMDALPVASAETAGFTKTSGVRVKKEGEVINKMALIKAVAEGKIPDVIFDINQGHINRLINMGIQFPVDAVTVRETAKYGGRG